MSALHDLASVVNGKLQVNMHPGQWAAWESNARFILVLAGTQGGKTSWGPMWFYREIQLRGPGDYLVATPTFPLLELKLLPEFRRLFERQLKLGRYIGSPTKKFVFSEEGARRTFGDRYDADTPTQIFFGHAQDPDSLESATAKAAWLDEAGQRKFKRGSWEAILRRLSIHMGRVLLTTTPYGAFGWIKTELHDRAIAGDPNVALVNFESRMNPSFPQAEWERAEATLPKWKFDLMYRGKLSKPAGLIYDVFDEARMVIDPFPIPADWPRFMGLDFGGVNTAATKWALEPGTDTLYCYAEYLQGGLVAKEHAAALKESGVTFSRVFGGSKSEGQWRQEFASGGLTVQGPSFSDVEVGIDRVYGLIKQDRVRIFRTCEGTIEQFNTYSRVLDANDNPTEAIEDKETFHFLDTVRYILSHYNTLPAQHTTRRTAYTYGGMGGTHRR